MNKYQILDHWSRLPDNGTLKATPVPYGHRGSTYSEDGIRITDSREFIDSILARLKDFLRLENSTTRLHVTYSQSTDRQTREPLDSYHCYIQVHERGQAARAANAFLADVTRKAGTSVNIEQVNTSRREKACTSATG